MTWCWWTLNKSCIVFLMNPVMRTIYKVLQLSCVVTKLQASCRKYIWYHPAAIITSCKGRWCFKASLVWKVFEHFTQGKVYSLWTFSCSRSLSWNEQNKNKPPQQPQSLTFLWNPLPQVAQSKIFPCLCLAECLSRLSSLANDSPHWSHLTQWRHVSNE